VIESAEEFIRLTHVRCLSSLHLLRWWIARRVAFDGISIGSTPTPGPG
jgi:hypothetical protein